MENPEDDPRFRPSEGWSWFAIIALAVSALIVGGCLTSIVLLDKVASNIKWKL